MLDDGVVDGGCLVRLELFVADAGVPLKKGIANGRDGAAEFLKNRDAAERDVGRGVPTLVTDHELAVAELVSCLHDPARHESEVLASQKHPPRGVVRAGVEAARDQDQVWRVGLHGREHDPLEGVAVGTFAGAGWQRHIDVCAKARPSPQW